VEAARAAREAGADVALYSAESALPYFRPRLVALAFGQAEPDAIRMHPAEWYAGRGIELRPGQRAEAFNARRREITAGGRTERFDAIVVATGSVPVLPDFAAPAVPAVAPLWNIGHALAVRERARRGARIVVVGGGILGVEAAVRAADAGMDPEIVELAGRLMPAQLGNSASAALGRGLEARGIRATLGRSVRMARASGDGAVLRLDDGREISTDLCLVAIGARPDAAVAAAGGLAVGRGVVVDERLQASEPGCLAAGDVVQLRGQTRCSAREAASQGKVAGGNAAAARPDGLISAADSGPPPVSFRGGGIEVYAVGHPGGPECEERLLDGSTDSAVRALIVRGGIVVGVQMVGTREGFDQHAAMIGRTV
jgi:nitrite reductase (NADH) large subunit